jgi:hypothetical protein
VASSTAAKPATVAGPAYAVPSAARSCAWHVAAVIPSASGTLAGQLSFHSTTGGCSRSQPSVCAARWMWASISSLTAAGSSSGWYQTQYSIVMNSEMKNGTSTP